MKLITRLLTITIVLTFGLVSPAFAADGLSSVILNNEGLAVIGLGLAVFGGAMGQAKIASSILESIGRNPGAAGQMNTPFILGVAFVESLVILAFLIAARVGGLF